MFFPPNLTTLERTKQNDFNLEKTFKKFFVGNDSQGQVMVCHWTVFKHVFLNVNSVISVPFQYHNLVVDNHLFY